MKLRRNTLLTFDAFGTLITPREPIAKQYADAARRHGLSGFTEGEIEKTFRVAFTEESRRNPNYGKGTGLGATGWWANIINAVFQRYSPSGHLPKGLIPDLLNQFSSSRGYKLYPDVLPFFLSARTARQSSKSQSHLCSVLIGVLTNSDDRIPLILSDLGLKVGASRYGARQRTADVDGLDDVNFVALSYDIGHEKPDVQAFEAARGLGEQMTGSFKNLVHVGDDLEKDYNAAKAAGWRGIMVTRGTSSDSGKDCVRDLSRLEETMRDSGN